MSNSTAPSVNPPKQRRSQETLDNLLQASRELLETTVFEELTIQQIASRAGCSVGNFYARFKNKDAILPCLLEIHYAEMEREMDATFSPEAWEGAPLNRRVDAVIDFLMAIAQRQPGLIRTLVVRNNRRPDSIPVSIRAAARRMLRRFLRFSPRTTRGDEPPCRGDRDGGRPPDGRRRNTGTNHTGCINARGDSVSFKRGLGRRAQTGSLGIPEDRLKVKLS